MRPFLFREKGSSNINFHRLASEKKKSFVKKGKT